jgi:prepilin signal peptidase PulO-like enzyme (type II secretory pathway)
VELVVALCSFLFGLAFGSFLNVVIYRVPRGLSVVKPGSSCPKCGHRLGPVELVPLLSFFLQRGRCRACGERISWRYPLVEFLTGLGFAFVAWTSPAWTEFVVGCVFFSLLLVLAFIDLDHKILPNVLTLPGVVLGFAFSVLGWTGSVLDSVLGAVVGFGLITLIAVISRGGMGMGDAKLMAMIGAFSGWKAVFYVLFGASLLGSIGGIIYLYVTKQDRKTPIPFGPSLAVAAIVMYFFLK